MAAVVPSGILSAPHRHGVRHQTPCPQRPASPYMSLCETAGEFLIGEEQKRSTCITLVQGNASLFVCSLALQLCTYRNITVTDTIAGRKRGNQM